MKKKWEKKKYQKKLCSRISKKKQTEVVYLLFPQILSYIYIIIVYKSSSDPSPFNTYQ